MSEENEGLKFDFEEKTENADAQISNRYRHLFLGSQIGMQVLADILDMCHFGSTLDPEDKAEVTKYNLGIGILVKCGIFEGVKQFEIINALAGMKKVGN